MRQLVIIKQANLMKESSLNIYLQQFGNIDLISAEEVELAEKVDDTRGFKFISCVIW